MHVVHLKINIVDKRYNIFPPNSGSYFVHVLQKQDKNRNSRCFLSIFVDELGTSKYLNFGWNTINLSKTMPSCWKPHRPPRTWMKNKIIFEFLGNINMTIKKDQILGRLKQNDLKNIKTLPTFVV